MQSPLHDAHQTRTCQWSIQQRNLINWLHCRSCNNILFNHHRHHQHCHSSLSSVAPKQHRITKNLYKITHTNHKHIKYVYTQYRDAIKTMLSMQDQDQGQPSQGPRLPKSGLEDQNSGYIYRVAQNKIPHQTIRNIFATSGQILKILEAF